MAEVLAFHGLLPVPEVVEKVAAVPYDVVDSEEAAVLAEGNPLSFLRVSRPEIELEPGVDLYSDPVYAKAAANFKRLCEQAPLKLDAGRHLYVYSLKMGDHTQVGVIGAASAADYDKDIIKKHEKTRQDKEDDRTRHVVTLRSHTGPVFLTYKDDAKIDGIVNSVMAADALFDFTAPDGIVHKLWRVDEALSAELSALFADVPYLYVADGHHRAKAASRTAEYMREHNPAHTGKEEYNYFLSVIFPGSQLKILPYNRVVQDLNGCDAACFMKELEAKFEISADGEKIPAEYGSICMYIDGQWYTLKPRFDIASLGVIEKLDVSILQDNVLAPMLGIDDPRTSKRIHFVGGIRGTGELEKLVDSGKYAVAFSMYPTTVEQMMDIADAGAIMPPKSTWFEPKLRDGLVSHNF
ncbi:MAG: DUF1015 domain-containing protein [Victivallales bacterium]|nr:DUF1015 domain-containing protein [Victivallales bacterium]